VVRGKRSVISPENHIQQGDWVAEQIQIICQNLLSRPNLRRGPFVIEDSELRAKIGAIPRKPRQPVRGP
jgi:hypothetical protein